MSDDELENTDPEEGEPSPFLGDLSGDDDEDAEDGLSKSKNTDEYDSFADSEDETSGSIY